MTHLTNMLLFACLIMSAVALQCMDEMNKPVDWFTVYKLPRVKHSNKFIKEGTAYVFRTSNNPEEQLSNFSIQDPKSIIGNTLKKMYGKKPDSITYLLYNDQEPTDITKGSKGHTKGVVLSDEKDGLWLVHSVPHFPDISGKKYSYPNSGHTFGQNFLCISLDLKNLDKVGLALQYNQANIFNKHINVELATSLPQLVKATKKSQLKQSSYELIILSKKGLQFTTFAKSNKFMKDLYEDLVAPSLKTDLLVQTWTNVGRKMDSNCLSKYKVNNVEILQFKSVEITFKSTRDHSKWAVSPIGSDKHWLCIGDINRADSQKKRGGGTVCFSDKKSVEEYEKSIQEVEPCKKTFH